MDKLVFQAPLTVKLGTATFKNTGIILECDGAPLIKVVNTGKDGLNILFSIYDKNKKLVTTAIDGDPLIPEDPRVKISLESKDTPAVYTLDGETILETKRKAEGISITAAKLYTPGGHFVTLVSDELTFYNSATAEVGRLDLTEKSFDNTQVGISLKVEKNTGIITTHITDRPAIW